MAHQFDVADSKIAPEAPIIVVRRDQAQTSGGNVFAREVMEHFGTAVVVTADEDNRLYLLDQWRQVAGKRLVELPADLLDVADEDPLEVAKRELAEEAGLEAESWFLPAGMFSLPGFVEETVWIYLAGGLRVADKLKAHDEEADMTASWIAVDEVVAMVLHGEVFNGIALSGILLTVEVLLRGMAPHSITEPFDTRPMAPMKHRTERFGADADLKCIRQVRLTRLLVSSQPTSQWKRACR